MKIRNGTPDFGAPSLCESCEYATIIKGIRFDEQLVKCAMLNGRTIPFRVAECRMYLHASHPYINEMEQIAWFLITRHTGRNIGFVPLKRMTEDERRENASPSIGPPRGW